jgi:hypothetical protein
MSASWDLQGVGILGMGIQPSQHTKNKPQIIAYATAHLTNCCDSAFAVEVRVAVGPIRRRE